MAKQVPIDRLDSEIGKILQEYGDDVQENMNDIVRQLSKKGAQTVKSQAKGTFGGTGKYVAGWTSKVETGRLSAQGVIYNKDVPGLPHLLEHGHANRGGGRTPGRVHIANVEEMLNREFEGKVKSRL